MTRCAVAFSQHPVPAAAVGEVVGCLLDQIDPHPSLTILMAAGVHRDHLEQMAGTIASLLAPDVLVASTAEAVFGGAWDERAPAGLVAIAVNCDELRAIRLDPGDDELQTLASGQNREASVLLLLSASTFRVDSALATYTAGPNAPAVIGAVSKAGQDPADPQLILDGQSYADGAVGVVFGKGQAAVVELGEIPDDVADVEVDPAPMSPRGFRDPAGLVLFADQGVDLVGGPTLDFDLIFERFGSRLSGMVGQTFVETARLDGPEKPDGTRRLERIRFGPRAAALIIE